MIPLPKNRIIESVKNDGAKFELYYFLENDEPLYYSFNDCAVPNFSNVYDLHNGKIILAPVVEQAPFLKARVLDLYDDLNPNLKDYADRLSKSSEPQRIETLRAKLTQYDPLEVHDYLMENLKKNSLCNYAELKDIQDIYDHKSNRRLETYKYYLKGEFKSFGCTTTHNNKSQFYVYDNDMNYSSALNYFNKEIDIGFKDIIKQLTQKNMEM